MNLFDIQVGVKSALDANATLLALLANGADSIRDDVREDDSFPYISIYEVASKEDDTMTSNGLSSLIAIHIYSRYRGNKEVKKIATEVYNTLHNTSLTLAENNHIFTIFTSVNFFVEADGMTRHGQINFKIVTD